MLPKRGKSVRADHRSVVCCDWPTGLCGSERSFQIREPTYYGIRQSRCHREQGYKHERVIIVNGVCEERHLDESHNQSISRFKIRYWWNLIVAQCSVYRLDNTWPCDSHFLPFTFYINIILHNVRTFNRTFQRIKYNLDIFPNNRVNDVRCLLFS